MNKLNQILVVIFSLMLLSVAACDRQGPAEKAGESIDKAADEASESMNKAMDNMDDAAKDVKEKAEDTMDNMKD